jgi:hypothetical protein
MVDPVLGTVFDKRKVLCFTEIMNFRLKHFIRVVQVKKSAQAGLCEDCVRRLEKDVIAGDIPA